MNRKDKDRLSQLLTVLVSELLLLLLVVVACRCSTAEACQAEAVSRQPQICVIKFTPEATPEPEPEATPAPLPTPTPTPAPEPTPDPLAGYTEEDLMCIANMMYGEISAVCYDDNYTWEEQNQILQEWASIPLNHIKRGIAMTIPGLMKTKTSAGYYVWHPCYASTEYMDKAVSEHPEVYERCRVNALVAMSGQMQEPVPEGVIYADLARHGDTYKKYSIDTGWYKSTVYLCYA